MTDANAAAQAIVKILNLYIVLLCTHLYHFSPVLIIVRTPKYEFTLVYILSGSHVPLIRPVCLIPFVCHIHGN